MTLELPERTEKRRAHGLTCMIDRGLSLSEAQARIEVAGPWIDAAKIAWGSAFLLGDRIAPKLDLYRKNDIEVFTGGVLFEAFVIQGKISQFRELVKRLGFSTVEISDGSIDMEHSKKCATIQELSKDLVVISEFGSRNAREEPKSKEWVPAIEKELEAGASFVTLEGGGSGDTGIYKQDRKKFELFVETIITELPSEKLIWEAPRREQQIALIRQIGPNVNLSNIDPTDVLGLECFRRGLRADTLEILAHSIKE